jgi:shikimate dehydrogenase
LDHLLPGLGSFQGTFVDLVYGKTSTLLDDLKAKGLPVQDGLPMLIGQALLGQKLWWGKSADFSDVEAMLRSRTK